MAGPDLTADTTGNPWVEVFFDPADLDPDAVTLRIFRFSDERTWLVRGGVDIATGVAVLDFEVPFGVPATYRAEMFDAGGLSLGYTDTSTITVEYTGTVIHQPLSPGLYVPVRVLAGSAASLVRPFRGEFVEPEGATVGHWIGSSRKGLRGVSVSLMTETLDAAFHVQELLGTYEVQQLGVFCIRTSEGIRWPRTFFAQGDFAEVELDVHNGGEAIRFDATVNEVKPPFPGLVVPFLSYDDLDAAYADYDARDSAYATYTEQDRDYSLAGLA